MLSRLSVQRRICSRYYHPHGVHRTHYVLARNLLMAQCAGSQWYAQCTPANKQQSMTSPLSIGFFHPGAMGSALATIAKVNGANTYWASDGRSAATRGRATQAGLVDLGSVEAVCAHCDVLVSIGPNQIALQAARRVAEANFDGLFIEANPLSPSTVSTIAELIRATGAQFVDAAVIGPPPQGNQQTTTLYLSGDVNDEIPCYFSSEALSVLVLGKSYTHASAIKLCDSLVNKGQFALVVGSLAAAEALGVREQLQQLWSNNADRYSYQQTALGLPKRAAKAWRFESEMSEVAKMLDQVGLGAELGQGASGLFERLATVNNAADVTLADALLAILQNTGTHKIE